MIDPSPASSQRTTPGEDPQKRSGRAWFVLATYVVLTLAASVAMLALQPVTGIDPAALSLVQFGPALAALLTWLGWRRQVVRPRPAPWRQVRADAGAMVAACVLFAVIVVALTLAAADDLMGPQAVAGVPFVLFVVLQLVGATGEEIGWRGLMQPLLETRMGRLAAVLVTGIIWALWHVQSFAEGPVVAVSFVVSTTSFAVILGYLAEGNVIQRVLVAAIGHWLVNVAMYLVVGDDTLDRPQVLFVAIAALIVAVAVFAAYRFRGNTPSASAAKPDSASAAR